MAFVTTAFVTMAFVTTFVTMAGLKKLPSAGEEWLRMQAMAGIDHSPQPRRRDSPRVLALPAGGTNPC